MRKKLSFLEKKEIQKKMSTGDTSIRKLAIEYATSKSTISRVISTTNFNESLSIENSPAGSPKEVNDSLLQTTSQIRDLDAIVYETFLKLRANFIGINSSLLKKIAIKAAFELNIKNFKAPNGWADRFKK